MRSLFLAALVLGVPSLAAQPNARPGTDVTISTLGSVGSPSTSRIGAFPNGLQSWGISTTSCNVGSVNVPWFRDMDPDHPSIGMWMYREHDGRFEQISVFRGVKHGFLSTNSPGCGSCPGGSGSFLVMGCSDTYGSSLNYSHTWMAPPSEIDPWTGIWVSRGSHFDRGFPVQSPPFDNDNVRSPISFPSSDQGYRNLVYDSGLNVSGATFWVTAYYNVIGEPDANRENNFATRQFSSSWSGSRWNISVTGTKYDEPAIYRWTGATVASATNASGQDGRFYVAVKVTGPSNGLYHYEYAIFNRDNNRQGGAVRIPVCADAVVSNLSFRDPDDVSGNDWTVARSGSEISVTAPANGSNNLTWGNLYNISFDSDASPINGTIHVDQANAGPGNASVDVTNLAPLDLRNLSLGAGCGTPTAPVLSANGPASIGNNGFALRCDNVAPGSANAFLLSASAASFSIGSCTIYVNPTTVFFTGFANADGSGRATLGVPIPPDPALNQVAIAVQAAEVQMGGAFANVADLSSGLKVKLGTGNQGCN